MKTRASHSKSGYSPGCFCKVNPIAILDQTAGMLFPLVSLILLLSPVPSVPSGLASSERDFAKALIPDPGRWREACRSAGCSVKINIVRSVRSLRLVLPAGRDPRPLLCFVGAGSRIQINLRALREPGNRRSTVTTTISSL